MLEKGGIVTAVIPVLVDAEGNEVANLSLLPIGVFPRKDEEVEIDGKSYIVVRVRWHFDMRELLIFVKEI